LGTLIIVRHQYLLSFFGLLLAASCGTIDPGDNFVSPTLMLDEDFFYCRIQPEVINATSCASGAAGEGGDCHSARSALRLSPDAETDPAPACDGNFLLGDPPASYRTNFQNVQFTVQTDPLSSPFYRRPVGLDSHPREIFAEGSPEADLIIEWIGSGG